MSVPGAFIDRDGTIIHDSKYVNDPSVVRILPGAASAIRRLNEHGVRAVIVTNQSGIARGLLSATEYEAVRARVHELLDAAGAHVEATYMCPHLPEISGTCDCRKPGLGLFRQAAGEHDIDTARSLFVGDRWRDVAPAAALGGLPILLEVDSTPQEDRERARVESIETARSLLEAVDRFLATLPAMPEKR